jgi:hypothetical protein
MVTHPVRFHRYRFNHHARAGIYVEVSCAFQSRHVREGDIQRKVNQVNVACNDED